VTQVTHEGRQFGMLQGAWELVPPVPCPGRVSGAGLFYDIAKCSPTRSKSESGSNSGTSVDSENESENENHAECDRERVYKVDERRGTGKMG
jgi:hypothetical protein